MKLQYSYSLDHNSKTKLLKIAKAAAEALWNKMNSSNPRDCVRIGRMAKSLEDVRFIVDTF